MALFESIPYDLGSETLVLSVRVLALRRNERGAAESVFSLAELFPDAADWNWLCLWARTLHDGLVSAWINSYVPFDVGTETTRKEALGLLLLLFASEAARREASGEHLWRHVVWDKNNQSRFPQTGRSLFINGQPSSNLKEAIQRAAYRFDLRHHFGNCGDMQWLGTVLLQCGFTKQGFIENGANWLGGYGQWRSVQKLLSGNQSCESFCSLWSSLQSFRDGNISGETCRLILEKSPWLLPEWVPELLLATRRKPTLSCGNPEEAEPDGKFLLPFRLHWDLERSPVLITEAVNLAAFDLQSSKYDIVVANRCVATILRQPDGSLDVLGCGHGRNISFPVASISTPVIAAYLIGPDGTPVAAQSLTIFECDDEVTIYDLDRQGQIVSDPWTDILTKSHKYAVLCAPDLQSTLPSMVTVRFHGDFAKLYGFDADGLGPFLLQNEPFWQPRFAGSRASSLGDSLKYELIQEPGQLGSLFLRVTSNLADISITNVRIDRAIMPETKAPLGAQCYGPFDVPTRPKVVVNITVGGRAGASTISRVLDLADIHGTFPGPGLRQTSEGWHWLDKNVPLEIGTTPTEPIHWLVPKEWEVIDDAADQGTTLSSKWCLMEGNYWVGSAGGYGANGRQARPLPRGLGGYGLPLTVQPRPFNNAAACSRLPAGTAPQVIAASYIFDKGCVLDFAHVRAANAYRVYVHLRSPIEPDKSHRILWWDANTALIQNHPVCREDDSSVWYADLPDTATEPVAVAVTFGGLRIGSSWVDDWHNCVFTPEAAPVKIAARLRFFKMPICATKYRRALNIYLERNPGAALAFLIAWLGDSETASGLPSYLTYNTSGAAWDAAIQCFFSSRRLDQSEARKLIAQITNKEMNTLSRLHVTLMRLLPISPSLAVDVVCALLVHHAQDKQYRKSLSLLVLGLRLTANESEFRDRKRKLISQIASELSCDEGFLLQPSAGLISRVIDAQHGGSPLSLSQAENYQIALSRSDPFRRLITGLLLLH